MEFNCVDERVETDVQENEKNRETVECIIVRDAVGLLDNHVQEGDLTRTPAECESH